MIGIPEVKARAAARPSNAALDGNARSRQAIIPKAEVLRRDRKREMQIPSSAVRRDHASRRTHGRLCSVLQEQEEHASGPDFQRAESLVGIDSAESE